MTDAALGKTDAEHRDEVSLLIDILCKEAMHLLHSATRHDAVMWMDLCIFQNKSDARKFTFTGVPA